MEKFECEEFIWIEYKYRNLSIFVWRIERNEIIKRN